MKIVVTGGAGYIGSVIVEQLVSQKHEVVVLDNLSKGHREAVAPGAHFLQMDLLDHTALLKILADHNTEAVIHMAASSLVGESVLHPRNYYRNNVEAGLS